MSRVYHHVSDAEAVLRLSNLPIDTCPSPISLWTHHVTSNPSALAAVIPNESYTDFIRINRHQFDQLTNKLIYDLFFSSNNSLLADLKPGSFIGLMLEDQISSLLLIVSLLKADFNLLLLTAKQSLLSVENLMKQTGALCLIATERHKARLLAAGPQAPIDIRVPTNSVHALLKAPIPPNFDLPNSHIPDNLDRVRFCLHSSGSTNLPHPIYQTNRKVIADVMSSLHTLSSHDVGEVRLIISPIAHQMGFGAILGELLVSGVPPVFVLSPNFPGSPNDILQTMIRCKVTTAISVPAIFEELANFIVHDEKRWEPLQNLRSLIYGGAPLPRALGDLFASKRIRLKTALGSTESGLVAYTDGLPLGTFDQSLHMSSTCSYRMAPLDNPDVEKATAFELIVLKGTAGLAESAINCEEGFATEDVLVRGADADSWIYSGRKGDTLVHSNGEKTNTLILERAVESGPPLIKGCQIVGAGRNRCGILVEVDWGQEGDLPLSWSPETFKSVLASSEALQRVNEQVWKAVCLANEIAPAQSQIVKSMLYILPPEKHLRRSDKGNLRRHDNTRIFAEEIDSLYLHPTTPAEKTAKHLPPQGLRSLVAKRLAEMMDKDESVFFQDDNEPSLFDLGMTSVHSTVLLERLQDDLGFAVPSSVIYKLTTAEKLVRYLESATLTKEKVAECFSKTIGKASAEELLRQADTPFVDLGITSSEVTALREALEDLTKTSLPRDLLYRTSTLSELMNFLKNDSLFQEGDAEQELNNVKMLNDKFIAKIKSLKPASDKIANGPKVILLTGATGHLGVHLLSQFSASKNVLKIVCLLRGGEDRLRRLVEARRLSWEEITSHLIIECFDFEPRSPLLGLTEQTYKRLQQEVTHVLHNAWTVNFNLRVTDFEKDWLESTYQLLRFSSDPDYPAKVFGFTSSVSSVAAAQFDNNLIPESFFGEAQATMALNMGYGQSKYIAESMCNQAREHLGIDAHIFRCGQICGDTKAGVWKEEELVPMVIVNGGNDLGLLPEFMSAEDFIPVDICAASIAEILLNDKDNGRHFVWHLVNPRGGTWTQWAQSFQEAGLQCTMVTSEQFVQAVRESRKNTLNRLITHLPSLTAKSTVARLDTKESMERSVALRSCPLVNSELAKLSLDYWQSTGFYRARRL